MSTARKKRKPSPTPTFVLRSHTTDVMALCFCNNIPPPTPITPDDITSTTISTLVSGDVGGLLKFWDLPSRRVVLELNEHGHKGILNIQWTTPNHCLSQGRDGFIKIWALTGTRTAIDGLQLQVDCRATFESGSYTFTKMSGSLGMPSFVVAPARNDTFFEVWDLDTQQAVVGHCVGRKEQQQLHGKTGMVMCLKVLVTQAMVVSDAEAAVSNTATRRTRLVHCVVVGVESGEIGTFMDVLSTCRGPEVASVWVKDCVGGSTSATQNSGAGGGGIGALVGGGGGPSMGTLEPTVKAEEQYDKPLAASVLGLTGDDAQWSTQLHTEPVLCVDAMVDPLDPTAWFGVSGSADASIGVFRVCVETGVFVKEQTLTIKESGLSDVKIRPDGKVFATAGWDGCIRVFGVKKLQPLAIMRYHEVGVHAIEFGNVHEGVLCSASKDGKIAWWNIFEGKEREGGTKYM